MSKNILLVITAVSPSTLKQKKQYDISSRLQAKFQKLPGIIAYNTYIMKKLPNANIIHNYNC